LPGLGFIDGETKAFSFPEESSLKIPHMGWNIVKPQRPNDLIDDFTEQRFYFVHSYYVKCNNPEDILASTVYGDEFTCAIQHNNIYGTQFHPEKSHKFGMKLLSNFSKV
jgi:glutamine amidotransferase